VGKRNWLRLKWNRILELTGYRFKNDPKLDGHIDEGNQNPEYMMEQLKQCWEDWRHYNSIIWRLPSLTTAIVGGLLGVAFYAVVDPLPRALVIALAAFFSFSMAVALVKHRWFHNVRTRVIDYTCNRMLGYKDFSPIRGEVTHSNKIIKAYSCLLFSMQALFVVTAFLAIVYFIDAF
jgi:hypothetical protein